VWLANGSKDFSASIVDSFICAEIPDVNIDPLGYALVDEFMIHGPYGDYNKKCPCMKDDKCSKNFPKPFQDETVLDDFGFTIYRRRDDGRSVPKNGINLDNRNVVPYNMHLLKKLAGNPALRAGNSGRIEGKKKKWYCSLSGRILFIVLRYCS